MAAKKTKVPKKYTSGLSEKDKKAREEQVRKRTKASQKGNPSYKPMVGDDKAKTKPSRYTQQATKSGLKKKIEDNMVGNGKEAYLKAVAKATGYPLPVLREVHERGARAWATGHRPGASQAAWSRARVLSFVQKGKTTKTADQDLYTKARDQMKKRKKK